MCGPNRATWLALCSATAQAETNRRGRLTAAAPAPEPASAPETATSLGGDGQSRSGSGRQASAAGPSARGRSSRSFGRRPADLRRCAGMRQEVVLEKPEKDTVDASETTLPPSTPSSEKCTMHVHCTRWEAGSVSTQRYLSDMSCIVVLAMTQLSSDVASHRSSNSSAPPPTVGSRSAASTCICARPNLRCVPTPRPPPPPSQSPTGTKLEDAMRPLLGQMSCRRSGDMAARTACPNCSIWTKGWAWQRPPKAATCKLRRCSSRAAAPTAPTSAPPRPPRPPPTRTTSGPCRASASKALQSPAAPPSAGLGSTQRQSSALAFPARAPRGRQHRGSRPSPVRHVRRSRSRTGEQGQSGSAEFDNLVGDSVSNFSSSPTNSPKLAARRPPSNSICQGVEGSRHEAAVSSSRAANIFS
mmetsp:Transcript_1983/g.7564  ORF Transcript_1983/g.7564 Transcript_1983/m.7564 type:complete len:415 (-) Transcript_1983:407-1651(-)